MIIPSGWIHAVYTPCDSIVIGGNFLHAYHMEMQFTISQIEKRCGVPPKFTFPCFEKLMWWTAVKFIHRLKRELN